MSHIWDATLRSWRPVRSGEPGEYFWDGASWVPNTTGGDFRWQQSTQSWVPGPGGTHEWVQADRAWRPEPAEAGGEHYWNQATQSWVARTSTGFVVTPAVEILARSGALIISRSGAQIVGR